MTTNVLTFTIISNACRLCVVTRQEAEGLVADSPVFRVERKTKGIVATTKASTGRYDSSDTDPELTQKGEIAPLQAFFPSIFPHHFTSPSAPSLTASSSTATYITLRYNSTIIPCFISTKQDYF